MRKVSAEVTLLDNEIKLNYIVDADDFSRVGEASSNVKGILKKIGVPSEYVRRTAITMYEGEINMVIHAGGGEIDVRISTDRIKMILKDNGNGIADVEKAMQAGYSTASDSIRTLGFGAGMGLPNMKKYSDYLNIDTKVGYGTTVTMIIYLNEEK